MTTESDLPQKPRLSLLGILVMDSEKSCICFLFFTGFPQAEHSRLERSYLFAELLLLCSVFCIRLLWLHSNLLAIKCTFIIGALPATKYVDLFLLSFSLSLSLFYKFL